MNIEKEIEQLKERNKRVEVDKAWETSKFRVLLIMLITYATTSVVFYLFGVKNFYLSALIPSIGYFLSTLTIPFIKEWWIKKHRK